MIRREFLKSVGVLLALLALPVTAGAQKATQKWVKVQVLAKVTVKGSNAPAKLQWRTVRWEQLRPGHIARFERGKTWEYTQILSQATDTIDDIPGNQQVMIQPLTPAQVREKVEEKFGATCEEPKGDLI